MDNLSAGQNVSSSDYTNTSLTFTESQGQIQGQGELIVPFSEVYRAPLLRTSSGGSLPETVQRLSASNGSLLWPPHRGGHCSSAPVSTVIPGSPCSSNVGSQDIIEGDYANILNAEEGWDLVFIKRSEKYDCPICLLVLREPMQTECGHRFCRGCILKWLRESKSICPVDNQPLDERQLFQDNFAKREILSLSVKCPNHQKGCDQIITLNYLKQHLESCLFSLTACPNQCANILYRGQLSEHLLHQCLKRSIKCPLCQSDIVAEKQGEHGDVCPQSTINCPSCEHQLRRAQLSQHLNSECTKTITRCQYHLLGCGYEAQRGQMEDHESTKLIYHMSLINRSLISICTALRIDPTSQQFVQGPSSLGHQPTEGATGSGATSFPSYFTNPKDSMNFLQRIFQHFNMTPNDVNALHNNEVNTSLPIQGSTDSEQACDVYTQSGRNITTQAMQMPANQQGLAVAHPTTVEEQEGIDSERTNTNRTQSQKLSYFSEPYNREDHEMPPVSMTVNELRSIKCQNDLQDESLARHDQGLFDLKHQNEFQDKVIRELRMKVKNLESTVQDFEGRCGNGVYMWKIKNYFKLRRDAERGEITAVHSNSFYSCYYGYKLCIRVNLNGVDSARGTHLSLFIHFMQGEYDELLEWPFNGRIILTVIDQNPICELRNDISETLLSKPNLAAFQRPTSTRNHKGFGYMEFLPLSVIDGSTYVRNDTLVIKASVIPSST